MKSVDELFANENQVNSFAELVSEVVGVRHGPEELRAVFFSLPAWVRVIALADGMDNQQFKEDALEVLVLLQELTCGA